MREHYSAALQKRAIHPKISKLATDNFVAEQLIITPPPPFYSISLTRMKLLCNTWAPTGELLQEADFVP